MPFLPIAATILTTLFFAALIDFDAALLFGVIVGLLAMQRLTNKRMKQLQQQLDALATQFAGLDPGSRKTGLEADKSPQQPPVHATAAATMPEQAVPAPAQTSAAAARAKNLFNRFEEFLRLADKRVLSYFTDGNVFVRVGILILFVGVAFLLKYAAENSRIPLEFRFMGAAAGGILLLGIGWRLRVKKRVYGLLLQGAGLGIIYITVFAAYQLASLLPATLAFVLMFLFAAFTVALAVLQNSRALAIFAVVGGFLAPLLASSGSNNYIGLFSYYALLNTAIFVIAWYKSWRMLNLLGFVFTFGVFAVWMMFSYEDSFLVPASLFLLLFFLMYSLIGVLYAVRQPGQLTGLVDGTLVFGTPVIASSLLMAMLRDFDYGIAAASASFGIYYVLLARIAWQRAGPELRLLCEAMLAIGVVFATLAIPYSLDGHWTSAAWALEAAAILWVSLRQNRFYAQCFSIALQFGAGVLFLLRNVEDTGSTFLLNPAFLGGLFISLGAFISARLLYLQPTQHRLRRLHIALFVWAMGWWIVSAMIQIDTHLEYPRVGRLLLFTATAGLLVHLDRQRHWDWRPASVTGLLLLPVLVLISLGALASHNHLLVIPDLLFWPLVLFASYQIIRQLEAVDWARWVMLSQHTGYVFWLACLLSFELLWFTEQKVGATGDGFAGLFVVFPLLFIHAALNGRIPAIARLGSALKMTIIASLSALLALWSLASNISNSGDPSPLPYLPLMNPLDLAHIAFFVTLVSCLRKLPEARPSAGHRYWAVLGGLAFVWLSAVLIRSLHHYMEIPFDLTAMAQDTRVQTALSILWTIIGMLAMLFAAKRALRPLWIAGAILITVVLVKMIFIDFGAAGTVERIVSFLVVGSLLVAMGYFSPIPQQDADTASPRDSHA